MTTCYSMTTTIATVLHSQLKSRMSLYLSLNVIESSMKWGPGFSNRGCKDYKRASHVMSARHKPFRAGVQGPIKGPGSSRSLDVFLCYLCLILKHFDTKRDKKKTTVNQSLGGSTCYAPYCIYLIKGNF